MSVESVMEQCVEALDFTQVCEFTEVLGIENDSDQWLDDEWPDKESELRVKVAKQLLLRIKPQATNVGVENETSIIEDVMAIKQLSDEIEQPDQRIAELQKEIAELKAERSRTDYWVNYHNVSVRCTELKSENARLRDRIKELEGA